MKRPKTNRRVNKSADHGRCYCLACDIEKNEQYIKKKDISEWEKGIEDSIAIHLKSGSKFLFFTKEQIKKINN